MNINNNNNNNCIYVSGNRQQPAPSSTTHFRRAAPFLRGAVQCLNIDTYASGGEHPCESHALATMCDSWSAVNDCRSPETERISIAVVVPAFHRRRYPKKNRTSHCSWVSTRSSPIEPSAIAAMQPRPKHADETLKSANQAQKQAVNIHLACKLASSALSSRAVCCSWVTTAITSSNRACEEAGGASPLAYSDVAFPSSTCD